MTKRRRRLTWLLTLVFCLGLFAPLPVSAADLYFTAINDNVRPLTADTMPIWYGNVLYVPYTVFDSTTNGGFKLGIDSASYNRNTNTVSLLNLSQILRFDLNAGTCQDYITGEYYSARAILRNGLPYLPLKTVCAFFGLDYSYTAIRQGYLVRIKSSAVVLSDADFIDAAENSINNRLRQYNQSLNPTPSTDSASTVTPPVSPSDNTGSTASPTDVNTYLAFRYADGESTAAILDALDSRGQYALFLFPPQALQEESGLVRRILGTGHSIGLLAEGADLEQTRALLAEGNRLLERLAYTRTAFAYVPKEQRTALAGEGWACWNETLSLSPGGSVSSSTFSANTLRRLKGRSKSTYLTIDGSLDAARVLPTLLSQLNSNHFTVSIPMETRL